MTRQLFIWIVLFGLTASCGQQSKQDRVVEEKKDSTPTVLQRDTLAPVTQKTFHFDTLSFRQNVDSLIKSIYSTHMRTTLQVDTFYTKPKYDILNYYPFADSAQWTIKYRFRPNMAA